MQNGMHLTIRNQLFMIIPRKFSIEVNFSYLFDAKSIKSFCHAKETIFA